jgi:putative nucleotidyltransferase with HDIG domain
MNKEPSVLAAEGGIIDIISREKTPHIKLHKALLFNKKDSDIKEGRKRAKELFLEAIITMKGIVRDINFNQTVAMRKMNTVIQAMVDNVLADRDDFIGLTNLRMCDEYTFAHCVNTSILTISLAALLSLEKPQIASLGIAAMLHDIGKMRIPPEIIYKTDNLTDEEDETIKRHPIEGALVISEIPEITKIATVVAFEHHKHDGAYGYPHLDGIVQQHLFSQIVSLADAYEVLNATRVYYNVEMPPDQVIRILVKQRGSNFNSDLVKAFINMIGIFPVGTLLKLSTGEIGLVLHQTGDLMRPRVLLLNKFDGSEKESGEETSILETTDGNYKRNVVGTIDSLTANIDIKQYLN